MIRVLNVTATLNCGGMETTVMNYYRHLDRNVIQFDFFVSATEKCYYDDEAVSLGARLFRQKIRQSRPITNAYQIVKCLREHPEIQVVHIHSFQPSVARYAFFARLCGVPVVIAHSHSAIPNLSFWEKLFRPLIRVAATHRFACSEAAGRSMFGKKAPANKKLNVIPNALDLDNFRYKPERRNVVRQQLDLNNRLVLINVGRLDYPKNQTFLLDAFNCLLKQMPDSLLLIAGEGQLRAELTAKAEALEITDSVRFLGLRDDVPDLLQAADLFVLPSLFEGLPVTAIEAQSAGLPCLLSNTITPECKVTELVEFLPIDKDPDIWAEKILAYRDYARQDMLENVRQAGYDIQNAAKKLETFYLDALKKKGR